MRGLRLLLRHGASVPRGRAADRALARPPARIAGSAPACRGEPAHRGRRLARVAGAALAWLVACRGESPAPAVEQRPVPVRLALGDCARISRSFEVGPRPMPLTAARGSADPAGPPVPRTALDYRPGLASPLRTVERALADCFDAGTSGVLLVDLVRSTAGTTLATVHASDERTRWCVGGVARTLVLEESGRRCPLAYGTMPLDEAPTIELTKTELRWNGRLLAMVADIVRDDSPIFRVDVLVETASAFFDAASTRQLAARGPIVLRAVPETPMLAVNRVLNSVDGYEVLLAAQAGTSWRLVDSVTLPVVPVPAGSGGIWQVVPWNAATPPSPTQPAMLIEPGDVWIGVSQPGDATAFHRGDRGLDWARVTEALRAHAGRRAGRTDLQIAVSGGANEDVTYGQLVRAIEAAQAAGFTDWRRDGAPPTVKRE